MHGVLDALRVYHKEITGRILTTKWLEQGRDDANDAAIGAALPRVLTATEVKSVRERFIDNIAARLKGDPQLAA